MNSEDINPYAAPQAAAAARASNPADAPPASLGKRFLNWVIDRLGVIATLTLIVKILILLERLVNWQSGMAFPEDIGAIFFSMVSLYLAAAFVYYSFFEAFVGRTLGQWIAGTKVVTASGAPLTFRRVLLRSLCRLMPFDALSFFNTNTETGWHDRWAGTRVVDLRAKPAIKLRPMPSQQPPRLFRPVTDDGKVSSEKAG